MAMLAANTIYLAIDSVDVKSYFTEVTLEPSNNSIDITAGSGTEHVERAAGLNDTSISMSIGYDAADVQTYIQKIRPGQVLSIEYGPEGNTSGKPKHVQTFNITGAGFTVNVDKSFVVFDVQGEGAAAPSSNMFTGSVY
jgi:hypothetical protein